MEGEMKFLITVFVSLFVVNIYSQADLDFMLTFITDENPQYNTWELNFGLDSTATNGIDPWLGESAYPPDACGGWGFTSCIAFYIPPDISARDYRYGVLPFTGQVDHMLWITLGGNATQAEVFWDFPEGIIVHVEDLIGGGLLQFDMEGSGSFIFDSFILSIFHRYLMEVTYTNIVPVELISFTASILQNEKAIQLHWTTATETNNSGFEIHRKKLEVRSHSPMAEEWETIAFVAGFGSTTEPKSYSFTDENVTTGTYKYRLKQIDFDGTFEYSNEIEVEVDFTPKEFVLYQNYPNPFNPNTVISYQLPVISNVTLKVYDILGNEVATLVNEEKQAGVYEVEFNTESGIRNPVSGVYFYQLKAGSFSSIKKMILLK
jgi:hypothetical protein